MTKARKKLGILGGSFNPIHLGHIKICETILSKFPVEHCVLMPNFQSPHKWAHENMSTDHRLKMIQLAIAEYKDLGIEYSTWEIEQNKISYTINALKHFDENNIDALFIMGADAFCDIASWRDYRQLFQYADFAIVARPGHDQLAPEQMIPLTLTGKFVKDSDHPPSPDVTAYRHESGRKLYFVPMSPFPISSSALRARLREGKDCTSYVPEQVLDYIYKHKLYAESVPLEASV